MIYNRDKEIEYYQFDELLKKGVINCYTARKKEINFSTNLETSKIEENYKKICRSLNINRESIVRPKQKHTDIIKRVDELEENYDGVDGLITNKPGINLMLTYADCTPILIYDPINNAIGNIHSGWRGTVQKIGLKAIEKMKEEYCSKPDELIVCIGPCIKQCHFEVSSDVKEIFEKEFSYLNRNNDIIKKNEKEKGKYFIDTTLINRLILERAGVRPENIIDSNICTVCNYDIVHSYRKDREKSGRNIAIIGMK